MKISWITLVGVLHCCTSAFCCLKSFLDDEGPLKLDPLTEPLFKNDSVKEFLQVCGGKKYLTNDTELETLKKRALSKVQKGRDSECKMRIDGTEKYITNLQMYYLKNAQIRVHKQQHYLQETWKGWVRWVLFLIPLCLTTFLLLAGHFDYKTLPFMGNSMFQTDSTDGMKYQQYEWMRYLILPGNHSVFKGLERKMDDPLWVRYNRKDATFSWKTVKFGRFKFYAHKQISKNIEEDDVHIKKVNIWKSGWDFGQETPKHQRSPRNSK